jgi:hypothetical protein
VIGKEDVANIKEQAASGRGLWFGLDLPGYPDDAAGRAKHPAREWLPSDAHVTLCHFGKGRPPEEVERICEVAQRVGEVMPFPLTAEVTGVGKFWRRYGEGVPILLVNSAKLFQMRATIMSWLDANDVDFRDSYGFIPHVTLRPAAFCDILHTQYSSTSKYPGRTLENAIGFDVHFPAMQIVCGDVRVSV